MVPVGLSLRQAFAEGLRVDGEAYGLTLLGGDTVATPGPLTLSLTMLGVVTGVGFFIHLFASWYMRGEEGYSRFFTYTNHFIASMLFLVLADDLLFVYLGWEGVGLCSYLLIGFYYKDRNNGAAALKAFIVTRLFVLLLCMVIFFLYVYMWLVYL